MNVADSKAYMIPGVGSMTDTIESPLHLPALEDKAGVMKIGDRLRTGHLTKNWVDNFL